MSDSLKDEINDWVAAEMGIALRNRAQWHEESGRIVAATILREVVAAVKKCRPCRTDEEVRRIYRALTEEMLTRIKKR